MYASTSSKAGAISAPVRCNLVPGDEGQFNSKVISREFCSRGAILFLCLLIYSYRVADISVDFVKSGRHQRSCEVHLIPCAEGCVAQEVSGEHGERNS